MAQRVQVTLVDDLGDGEASETVKFGLDGNSYEIDLSAENAADLRDALAKYVAAARKRTGSGRRGGRSRSPRGGSTGSAAEIRDWARGHGYDVPDRGRVSAEVRDAYEAAH